MVIKTSLVMGYDHCVGSLAAGKRAPEHPCESLVTGRKLESRVLEFNCENEATTVL